MQSFCSTVCTVPRSQAHTTAPDMTFNCMIQAMCRPKASTKTKPLNGIGKQEQYGLMLCFCSLQQRLLSSCGAARHATAQLCACFVHVSLFFSFFGSFARLVPLPNITIYTCFALHSFSLTALPMANAAHKRQLHYTTDRLQCVIVCRRNKLAQADVVKTLRSLLWTATPSMAL